jgi:SAM-dependent methyltransferase
MGIDSSVEYIAFARGQGQDGRVSFMVGDARSLPAEAGRYDAVVSGLVLNFVPQPDQAVAEMVRVVRTGGMVAAYVWDYVGQMQLIRHFWNAAVALDAAALEYDEGRRFLLCQPEPLAGFFRSSGLRQVETRAIDVPTVFRSFADYWSPFLGGQGPAPGYAMALNEEQRAALRDRIRAGLPMASDGSIHLIARAWAVRGLR